MLIFIYFDAAHLSLFFLPNVMSHTFSLTRPKVEQKNRQRSGRYRLFYQPRRRNKAEEGEGSSERETVGVTRGEKPRVQEMHSVQCEKQMLQKDTRSV